MSHRSEIKAALTALAKAKWKLIASSHSRGVAFATIMKSVYQRPYAIVLEFEHRDGRESWLALHPQTGEDNCILADWRCDFEDFHCVLNNIVSPKRK
jgi:hypothetical protein